METTDLRLAAAKHLVGMNLPKDDKLIRLEYIKTKASETELKSLILDNSFTLHEEESTSILNDRFESYVNKTSN